jgi:hypothetical protein
MDVETGLLNFRNRLYSPEQGRFVSRDPLGYVDALGLHEFVGGNPGNYVDPWGLDWNNIQPDLESDVRDAVNAGLLTQEQANEILSQASEAPGKIDRAANFAQHFLEQGYPLGVAGIFTAYWVAADLVGIASIAESMQGFDIGTQQNLSGLERGLKFGFGAFDALTSYYALKAIFRNPCPPKPTLSQGTNKFLTGVEADYWKYSAGMTPAEAKAAAKEAGFNFEIGRVSRFENSRNAVIIGKPSLQGGAVNRIELAEEIQHGLDRATQEASRALRRNLSNEAFHQEVFQRIMEDHSKGGFRFLTDQDIKGIKLIIKELNK